MATDKSKLLFPSEPRQDFAYIKQLKDSIRRSEVLRLLEKVNALKSDSNLRPGERSLALGTAFIALQGHGYPLHPAEAAFAASVRCCISCYSLPTDKLQLV